MARRPESENLLYYGDNLGILRRYVKDESVDLVYLDPPFKSNQDYNILFAEQDGSRSAAQIKAFEDTWCWDQGAAEAYETVVEGGGRVAQGMQAFRQFLGESDMLAYLAMMAPRLIELRRVMKTSASIYLHCDPTASHYLKLLMDAIFGPIFFKNEIIWQRAVVKGDVRLKFGSNHDVLLFFGKGGRPYFESQFGEPTEEYKGRFRLDDADGRGPYRLAPLDSPNPRPNLTYDYKGYSPPTKGWRVSREVMEQLEREARLAFPRTKKGRIARKHYLYEQKGPKIGSVWTDIGPLQAVDKERLGYPTQKPEALLHRIISASSNPGDTVLDPFCGCGTAIAVAHRLNRRWLGIDITHLAISLIKNRMKDAFGEQAEFKVIGEPVDVHDAGTLAGQDPYQFQWWALGLVGARPVEQKKGADKGIDGRIYFHDEPRGGKTKQVILSVKAGKASVPHVRDLRGVIEREKAAIGVLISLQKPTKPMRGEAASAGFYDSERTGKKYSKIQLLTVEALLAGSGIDMPPSNITFKKAARATIEDREQPEFV